MGGIPFSLWICVLLLSHTKAQDVRKIDIEFENESGVRFVPNDGDVEELDLEGNFDIKEENNVLVLNTHNFKHVVHKREFVLVEFYAPWCAHCKQLVPIYEAAAKELKSNNLTLAKVDATVEVTLAKQYMITSYPNVILFHKGKKVEEYSGERSSEGIVSYMKIRTDPAWKPPPTAVVELNGETFRDFLKSKALAVVLFYADYCKHCEQIKPEFKKAASVLKEYGIVVAQIDAVNNMEINDEFKVVGYPTLMVFRYGLAFKYKGRREANEIISYMKEQQKSPSFIAKTKQELDNRIHRYYPTVIGAFKSKESPFYKEYLDVANYLRDEPIKFVHTFQKSLAKSLGVNEGGEAIILRKAPVFVSDYEDHENVLTDATMTGDFIAEFIRRNYRPLVGLRTKENEAFFYTIRPLVVVYYDANFDHQYQKASEMTRIKVCEVAKEFRNVTFAVANEDEFQQELQAVKLDDSGSDVNVVWFGIGKLKHKMEPVDDFSSADLRTFVTQAQKGLLKRVWKSQPIPLRQDGPLSLVADNFESEVLTRPGDRDIVFYIYAPWCGHCQKFNTVYEKIAKDLGNEKLVFSKMDATGNDLPPGFDDIRGYPTIFFIPAYKKHEPLLYKGDRTYDDFKDFVLKSSTIFLIDKKQEGRNNVEL